MSLDLDQRADERAKGLKQVFLNWSKQEVEEEMMGCYRFILNTPRHFERDLPHDEHMEAWRAEQDLINSAMNTLRFIMISTVVDEETKSTAELLHKECEVRLSAKDLSNEVIGLMIKTKFGAAIEDVRKVPDNTCLKCQTEDSLDPIIDGSVMCLECNHVFFP